MPPSSRRRALAALLLALPSASAQLCASTQSFAEEDFAVTELKSGESYNATLCPQFWAWFRIQTEKYVDVPTLTQNGSEWREEMVRTWMPHGVSIAVDAAYEGDDPTGPPGTRPIWKFTSLEFIAVNGTPPGQWEKPNPYDNPEAWEGLLHARSMATDRETVALGFNSSAGACADNLDEYVYVGIKCLIPVSTFYISGADHVCGYNVTLTALPFELYEGVDLTAHIRPAYANLEGELSGETFPGGGYFALPLPSPIQDPPPRASGVCGALQCVWPNPRHYYRLSVGEYDTIQLTIERVGDGVALKDQNYESTGVGLAGGVYTARDAGCPSAAEHEPYCSIGLNDSAACEMRNLFCSTYREAGEVIVMVEARITAERPYSQINVLGSKYRTGCEPTAQQVIDSNTGCDPPVGDDCCDHVRNMVGPDGARHSTTIIPNYAKQADAASDEERGTMPQWNDPIRCIKANPQWVERDDCLNELREDRGAYRLRVRKQQFEEGAMLPSEVRPGCVSYGQWRYFTITPPRTTSSVMVHLVGFQGTPMAVYARAGARPTVDTYDVIAERRAGSRELRLVASACDMRARTTWYLAVALEKEEIGISRGVRPLEFNLSVHVEDARLVGAGGAVAARGGDGAVVKAAGAKGNGYTCCGTFKSFVVPNLAARYALKVVLNVTKGHVRALFLKHGSCPALPADITEEGTCQGLCVATWLTTFDPYDGAALSRPSAALTVPNGLGIDIDRRAEGDWYVSVLSLDGEDAEYRLRAELIDPPAVDDSYKCDKWEAPCPQQWMADSAAAAGRRPAVGTALAAAAAALALLRRGRPLRRHT